MALFSALQTAQNSLFALTRQTLVTTSNISNADNPNYASREVQTVSGPGGPRIYKVNRSEEPALYKLAVSSLSAASGQEKLASLSSDIRLRINGVDGEASASAKLGTLRDALQLYSSEPSNKTLAESVVIAATDLANTLNIASTEIQSMRNAIDEQISADVSSLTSILAEFKTVNDQIVEGTRLGRDVNDALDRRDVLQKQIAEIIPVRSLTREDNDVVLFTEQGLTLFETEPRSVEFSPVLNYDPGVSGNAIFVDGVPILQDVNANTADKGSLGALIKMRDEVLPGLQAQNDEIARVLVQSFAESDSGGGPDLAGLFSYSGGPAIPAAGLVEPGIAMTISVNAAFDPQQGGNPDLIRDGGANGASYVANTSGGSGFSERLNSLLDTLTSPVAFDASAGIQGDYSIVGYAARSVGWLDGIRSSATFASESKSALYQSIETDYLAATGVSIDAEMSKLIAIEQSYQASAQIIRVVDKMFEDLLATVR